MPPSRDRFNEASLLKSSEPGIGKNVARTISRPARRIHLAMRPHRNLAPIDLAAALSQVTD